MSNENENRLFAAWDAITARYPLPALTEEVRLSVATAKALADNGPLDIKTLSTVWGLPLDQAQQILEATKGRSVEVDEQGRLIGAAGLSLKETDHQLSAKGKTMYAWCSWDALFLPAYLDSEATVRSIDPTSGEEIKVEVAPTEVLNVEPAETVISVLVPDLDSPESLQTGPSSKRCSSMQFFTDPHSAHKWIGDQQRLITLTPDKALQIAHQTWLTLLSTRT